MMISMGNIGNTTKAKEAITGTAAGTGTHHVALVVALHGSPNCVRHRCVNPLGVERGRTPGRWKTGTQLCGMSTGPMRRENICELSSVR